MSDVPSAPTITCPACGVAVAVGYPRCPRCHAAVPQASRARRQTFRDQAITGGTSVEAEGGAPWPWIALGVLALVAALGIAFLLSRDPDRRPGAAVDAGEDEEGVADEPTAADDPDDTDDDAPPTPTVRAGPPADTGAAVRGVSEALRIAQLWAKVRRDGALLEVQSALCDDAAMWPTIAGEAEELVAAGITTVQCIAPHGAVVFERGL